MKKKDFAAFQSSFLSKEDLASPRVLTIDHVAEQELQGDGGKELKPVAHFREADKGLVLNNINWDTIQDAYGDESDDWTGKKIELYFDPSIMFGSKRVGGIRVRLPAANGARSMTLPKNDGSRHWTWDQAIQHAANAGITKPELVERMKTMGLKGYNPERDTSVVQEIIEAKKAEEAFDNIPAAVPQNAAEEDIPF